MHLKQHYEPPMQSMHVKVKQNSDCEANENNIIMDHTARHHHVDATSVPESLMESLEDSQGNLKDEEELPRETLPEIDEFNEFSEPEDMMEDLRKEVEKVVETIADNECMPESTWNYQVTDEIDENEAQNDDDLQLYSENLDANYDDIDNAADDSSVMMQHENTDTRNFDSEDDDEDDVTLEQVRQSLQSSTRAESDSKKFQLEDDKEDLELTECLKKIHNFKCTFQACNKAFNSRTALGYHLKTHTTERRYVCDQVSKKLQSNSVEIFIRNIFSAERNS